MKPKRIVRRKEACGRLGCGKTKFGEDYEFHDPADPFVPNTEIPRLKPIHLGPRNVGFLEHEIDALIDGLAKLRDARTQAAPSAQEKRKPRSLAAPGADA
jgi:predicted DNA-binding transcriptional regulator AlpA